MASSPPQFTMNYHPLIVKIYSIKTKVKFVIWLKGEGRGNLFESDLSLSFLASSPYTTFLLFFSLQCQIILFNCLLVLYPITYHHYSHINMRSAIYSIYPSFQKESCPPFQKGVTNFNQGKATAAANSSSFSSYARGFSPTGSFKNYKQVK